MIANHLRIHAPLGKNPILPHYFLFLLDGVLISAVGPPDRYCRLSAGYSLAWYLRVEKPTYCPYPKETLNDESLYGPHCQWLSGQFWSVLMDRVGFEPTKPKQQIYSLPVLTTYLPIHIVQRMRFELILKAVSSAYTLSTAVKRKAESSSIELPLNKLE